MMRFISLLLFCGLAVTGTVHAEDTADELWQKLQVMLRTGPPRSSTKESAEAFLAQAADLTTQFIQNYSSDRRVWEAKLTWLQLGAAMLDLRGQKPDLKAVKDGVREILDSPDASRPVKAEASYFSLEAQAAAIIANQSTNQLDSFNREVADFIAKYPTDSHARELPMLRLNLYEKVDSTKATELLKELAKDSDPRLAAEAQRRLKALEVKSKPLDLKFTTVDGKEFDIAKWRGKVVLVDFWATWCGPCRMEIPHVVAAFKKLHEKGFEIVGVSLDSKKETLVAFTQDKEMTWPQYFDGKGWGNAISTAFGINGIPAMWLVDKKGFVRSTEARADLENQITKLLAE